MQPPGIPGAKGPVARILVVDDYPANVVALEAVLAPLKQPVIVARSGEQALEHALHEDFAVVLMDVNLPGIDGLETAAAMRRSERSRRVPVIFLTGLDRDPSALLRGYALGAVDYLVKPFDADILRSKVSVLVDLHLMREEVRDLANAEALATMARAERARFYSLLMQAPVAIAVLAGPSHLFELANLRYCQMVNRQDLIGQQYFAALEKLADGPTRAVFKRVFEPILLLA